jgi:serine/threonine protein phosphatase 1
MPSRFDPEYMTATTYYAVGDVHGEADKLARLVGAIENDARLRGGDFKIIFLGDMIDRGPQSREVVDMVMRLQKEGRAEALKGNHEELMLYAYERDESDGLYHWSASGGEDTIRSYQNANGRTRDWREAVDRGHLNWLRRLPTMWRDETRGLVFVHAGIDPKRFPECPDSVHMWSRSRRFLESDAWPDRYELKDIIVVHGHTPTTEPQVERRRINVDTGACFGGPLTCAVLAPNEAPRFLSAA